MSVEILSAYEKTGALKKGHFQLTSGLHTDTYLQSALVLQYPEYANQIGGEMARPFRDAGVEVVLGPAVGGIVVSHVVGSALKARSIYAERKNGKLVFYRGFEIRPAEKVLIVEDVVTTGGSVLETIEVAERAGGKVVGIASIVERSGGKVRFDAPYHPLLIIEAPSYPAELCPWCRNGDKATIPGSRGL